VPTTQRVHPAPLYELIIWSAIGVFLWHMGTKALNSRKINGEIFCAYLIFTGVARFVVEIVRINPPWIFGMSNAQVASVASVLAGALLLWRVRTNTPIPQKNTT